MNDTREEAHRLLRLGLPITLCPPGTKTPLGVGWDATQNGRAWQKMKWTHKEIDRAFRSRGQLSLGVRLGPSSGLIDIEDDSDAGRVALAELFDDCPPPVTPTFASKRGTHRLFALHPELEATGTGVADYKGLEVRIGAGGKGTHSIFPPSVTDGVERKWLVPLDDCPAGTLPQLARERIVEAASLRPSSIARSLIHREHRPSFMLSVSSVFQPGDSVDAAVLAAINATLPKGPGQRHRCIFKLARYLKAITPLNEASPDSLRSILQQWHERALPLMRTKPFEETWFDFLAAWPLVKYPEGQGPVAAIFARAMSRQPPQCAERYERPELRALVSLCRELQQVAGDQPFFLSCRSAGSLIGVSHLIAARWLKGLCMDKILQLAQLGELRRHQASQYHYGGDRQALTK